MQRWSAIVILTFATVLSTGCSMCCGPYDFDYPTYGGIHQRANPSYGRVGSVFSDPFAGLGGPSADSNLKPHPEPRTGSGSSSNADSGDREDEDLDDDLEELDRKLDQDLESIEPLEDPEVDSETNRQTNSDTERTTALRWRRRATVDRGRRLR